MVPGAGQSLGDDGDRRTLHIRAIDAHNDVVDGEPSLGRSTTRIDGRNANTCGI
jgi:hypothetical protein